MPLLANFSKLMPELMSRWIELLFQFSLLTFLNGLNLTLNWIWNWTTRCSRAWDNHHLSYSVSHPAISISAYWRSLAPSSTISIWISDMITCVFPSKTSPGNSVSYTVNFVNTDAILENTYHGNVIILGNQCCYFLDLFEKIITVDLHYLRRQMVLLFALAHCETAAGSWFELLTLSLFGSQRWTRVAFFEASRILKSSLLQTLKVVLIVRTAKAEQGGRRGCKARVGTVRKMVHTRGILCHWVGCGIRIVLFVSEDFQPI